MPNVINGTAGNDILAAGGAGDSINGLGGDDNITSFVSTTVGGRIDGGDGNDTITSWSWFDTILGGNGNDLIISHAIRTSQQIDGGAGNDTWVLDAFSQYATPLFLNANSTAFTVIAGGINTATVTNVENIGIYGGSGADSLTGGNGNDTLFGGNATVAGGTTAADTLNGGAGDDVLGYQHGLPTTGLFSVDGGVGTNTLWLNNFSTSLDSASTDYVIDDVGNSVTRNGVSIGTIANIQVLNLGFLIGSFHVIGADGNNTIYLSGLSPHTITVGNGNNNIDLEGGNNIVTAGNGNNTIVSSANLGASSANQSITSGGGNDSISAGLTPNGTVSVNSGGGNDLVTITSVFDSAISGTFNVDGGAGNDTLSGEGDLTNVTFQNFENLGMPAGDVTLTIAQAASFNNILPNTILLVKGNGVIDWSASTTGKVTVMALGSSTKLVGTAFGDTLSEVGDHATIIGGNGNNSITATGGSSSLTGGAGNDYITVGFGATVLTAAAGNDLVSGGAGNDTINVGGYFLDATIDGGSGTNMLAYGNVNHSGGSFATIVSNSKLNINLQTGIVTDGVHTQHVSNFQQAGVMYDGGDTITCSDAGTLVNLSQYFNRVDDTIVGGAGNDTIVLGAARSNWALDDTGGQLRLKNINQTTAYHWPAFSGVETFQFNDFVNGNLILTAAQLGIIQSTAAGSATNGTAAADMMEGLRGNDTLWGGAGADTINGGGGINTVTYAPDAGATHGVYVDLSGFYGIDGFGATDTLVNIQGITGTNAAYSPGGYYSDFLTGAAAGGTTFAGLGGNDYITGKGTNNTTSHAQDSINGGSAGVYVDLKDGTAANAGYARDGFGAGDTLLDIQNIIGTNGAFAPGNYFSDLLYGANAGGSILFGLGGNDYLAGRGLNNTADYSLDDANGGHAGIYAALASNYVRDGFGASDGLANVQNITGTKYADTIYGDANANVLRGGQGSDYFDGGLGLDTIRTTSADLAAGDLDVLHNFHAGDILSFSADLNGVVGFVQQGADVIAYATVPGGSWFMDIQNATLAPVQASVVYV